MTDQHAHYLTRDQVISLLEERDTLRETVRQYEEILKPLPVRHRLWGLTATEMETLQIVRAASPNVCTKERLHLAVYGMTEKDTQVKVWDVRVCRVRKLLKAAEQPFTIETTWGRGYRMSPEHARLFDEALATECAKRDALPFIGPGMRNRERARLLKGASSAAL